MDISVTSKPHVPRQRTPRRPAPVVPRLAGCGRVATRRIAIFTRRARPEYAGCLWACVDHDRPTADAIRRVDGLYAHSLPARSDAGPWTCGAGIDYTGDEPVSWAGPPVADEPAPAAVPLPAACTYRPGPTPGRCFYCGFGPGHGDHHPVPVPDGWVDAGPAGLRPASEVSDR